MKHQKFRVDIRIKGQRLKPTYTKAFIIIYTYAVAIIILSMFVYMRISGEPIMQFMYKIQGVPIYSEETREETIEEIEALMQLSSEFYGYKPKQLKKLANYSLEKDKFYINNFGSFNSENGMCLGFSAYERLNYLDQIKDMSELESESSKNLGDIKISEEDGVLLNEQSYRYTGSMSRPGSINNYEAEVLYNMFTNYYTDNLDQDFSEKLNDKELGKILDDINYLGETMNKHNYPRTTIEPREYISASWIHSLRRSNGKVLSNMEPNLITDRIDKNDPVVIGIGNDTGGHALLIYAYERVNEDLILLYISDSNFILHENEDKYEQYNEDIKNNMYMLLKKDGNNGEWDYIYNPKINDNYPYRGEYNSLIPNTYMDIY